MSLRAMTLAEAIEILAGGGHACACCGPPPGETRCFCQIVFDEARELQRAAHTTVKLFADYASRS